MEKDSSLLILHAERYECLQELVKRGTDFTPALQRELAERFGCTHHTIRSLVYRIRNPRHWDRNRDVHQVASQNGRARKLGVEGRLDILDWRALCSKYNYKCLCCGQQKSLVIDHIVPISQGGLNTIENVQPLCWKCNSEKRCQAIDYRSVDEPASIPDNDVDTS